MTHTHTFAIMEVSQATYDEVRKKLEEAEYHHAVIQQPNGGSEVLDMDGIALMLTPVRAVPEPRHSQYCVWSICDNAFVGGHCPHMAQEHALDGHCEECKCPQYSGRELRHVEAK